MKGWAWPPHLESLESAVSSSPISFAACSPALHLPASSAASYARETAKYSLPVMSDCWPAGLPHRLWIRILTGHLTFRTHGSDSNLNRTWKVVVCPLRVNVFLKNQRREKQGQLKAVVLDQGGHFCPLPPPQEYLAISDDIKGMGWLDCILVKVERQGWPAVEALGKVTQRDKRAQPGRTWERGWPVLRQVTYGGLTSHTRAG